MKLGILLLLSASAFAQYWPSTTWRTATPESQGLDSQILSNAVDEVGRKQLGVHSLLVIRHGYAVLDAYFYPYDAATPHDLASVTKTITSVLTGIAVDRGLVRLDQPALGFFPKEAPAQPDERKQKITVGNLLRMESGLDCGYVPGEQELEQMKRSPNWVQFALGLPMRYGPGEHTSYCSPGYHLLGSLIGAAAKSSELEFARKFLFEPLAIQGVVWADDPQGRSHGWGDSHFPPGDVAKIGYLYLHGGNWNGKQIVPQSWVTMSTTPPAGPRDGPGGLGYEWGASTGANGPQFGGNGRGGQTLLVWPQLDLIVVSMGGGNTGQVAQMVRQAVKSDAKAPVPDTTSPIPPMAAAISGVTYDFPVNPSRIDSLALTFAKNGEARVDMQYYGPPLSFPIGLNGVYRLGPNGPFHLPAGAMGKWTSENEFSLDVNFIANINHYTLALRFDGDQVEVTANEASGLIRNGRLTGKRRP